MTSPELPNVHVWCQAALCSLFGVPTSFRQCASSISKMKVLVYFLVLLVGLTVLQLDAHADLRKEYEGSKCNHACALYEANYTTNLIQVGIRSMDIKEKSVMDLDRTYFAHDMAIDDSWMDSAIDQMTENVFITFDLDAFDPSILPSTGTPEPGGLFWYETMDFLKQVFAEKNVVGFDIVELCPNEIDKSSDFLAAKLYYKMLSYKFQKDVTEDDYDNTYNNKPLNNNLSKFKEEDDY